MSDTLTGLVIAAASVVSLICFIVVIVQMFQHGATGLGIACIVLILCCGLGPLIAFIFGWIKAREWNMMNLMIVWTIAIGINAAAGALNPAPYRQVQQIFVVQPKP
jgi:hypothetical protein